MIELAQPKLRHLGIYAFKPTELATFYGRWFGLVITDRAQGRGAP